MQNNRPFTAIDRKKSLRQLTGRAWRGDNLAAHLFGDLDDESAAAWKKPLGRLTDGELFILLSQRASLGKAAGYLLPLAVERLENEPLASGRSFPGELHTTLAMLDDELWAAQPDIASRWAETLAAASAKRSLLAPQHREILNATLEMARIRYPFVAAAFKNAKKRGRR